MHTHLGEFSFKAVGFEATAKIKAEAAAITTQRTRHLFFPTSQSAS
jgi:hypothetical protein